MSNTEVFIFDELFTSMVGEDRLSKLKSSGANLHIIDTKCKITDYEALRGPNTQKVLCINPDFVDWHFASEEYQDIPGLKAIISSSDNISWLDTGYADSHTIPYVALKNLTTEYSAVAEYAITIMMSLARNIPLLSRDNYPLDYAHDFVKYQGIDVAGKTVGIIGLGNIGGAIAKLCSALGMNVIYWSRGQKGANTYEYREIDDLLKKADIIFPTLKPNGETSIMLPNERLDAIKKEAIVVCVVGGLVDNDYLAKQTADNKLFGFGFGADPATFPNYSGNVWAIPDYAWATKNNMRASYDQFIEKILESINSLV
jgi:phosphoglycerate dehydrogenase-like enzyme